MIKHHDIACFYFVIFRWDDFTFRAFYQLYIHYFFCDSFSSPDVQSDNTACLLQCLHSIAVSYVSHIYIIYPQYTVINSVQRKRGRTLTEQSQKDINNNDKVFFEVQSIKTLNWCINKWSIIIIQATCKGSSSATATQKLHQSCSSTQNIMWFLVATLKIFYNND